MRGASLLSAICLGWIISIATADKKIVCYFGSWAVYRPGNGKFDISYIDPTLCTHLIYSFVGISGNNVRVLDSWQDLSDNWGKNGFGRFIALREQNPKLKTLVAIGGWNEGSTKYSQMAKNSTNREQFVANVVEFVKKYKFDGFDFDWEYPAQRGGSNDDVVNYVELLKLMRKSFDDNKLILSAAVAAAESSASKSYNILEMCKYLNFVNIMAYDLHGAWETKIGLNAPLYSVANDDPKFNVRTVAKYWLSQGCPNEKIILGMPLYGRTFTLSNSNDYAIGAAASGPGVAGPYTREAGMLGYNEICEKLQREKSWSTHYDYKRQAPYAHKGSQWIGYDNVQSIAKKAELVKELKLGGAMVWSIETDDFKGVCGKKYPLLKTLNNILRDKKFNVPSDKLSSSTIEQKSSTTQSQKNKFTVFSPTVPNTGTFKPSISHCTREGFVKSNTCDFIICVSDDRGGFIDYEFKCGKNLCFDPLRGICNWK